MSQIQSHSLKILLRLYVRYLWRASRDDMVRKNRSCVLNSTIKTFRDL